MVNRLNNLEIGIDSSLSYCSITLFKKKKIIWDKFQKCDYGHEKVLSFLLKKLVKETKLKPENITYLHINKGPARFTAIRNCHALAKGYFFSQNIKIFSYSIFEHYYLGISDKIEKNILCILDTNRRDLAVQKINTKGKLIGKTLTLPIDDKLVNLLKKDFTLIGNGLEKLNKISEFKFIKTKTLGPTKLYSNYFVKRIYNKKYSMKFPKIIYPYSPI
tara:strand:- start:912 stop:1565 length:654 start_codon:yes stop_codon:yes gene_type:complete